MIVRRVEKKDNFVIIDKAYLRDKRLKFKEIGLLTLILSLPETWEISVNGMASIVQEGPCAVRNAINSLEKYGYIKRLQKTADNGCFAGVEYIITERPTIVPDNDCDDIQDENPPLESPPNENPRYENPKPDQPRCENPKPDQLRYENPKPDQPRYENPKPDQSRYKNQRYEYQPDQYRPNQNPLYDYQFYEDPPDDDPMSGAKRLKHRMYSNPYKQVTPRTPFEEPSSGYQSTKCQAYMRYLAENPPDDDPSDENLNTVYPSVENRRQLSTKELRT